jgi:hypothetical protein
MVVAKTKAENPQTTIKSDALLGNILSVSLLTWLVTPAASRALRFWVSPAPTARQPRTDVLGLVDARVIDSLATLDERANPSPRRPSTTFRQDLTGVIPRLNPA